MRASAFAFAVLTGCAVSAPPAREPLRVPGLPGDLWSGFAPGSWVTHRLTRDGRAQESKFTLRRDGSLFEECTTRHFNVGHGDLDFLSQGMAGAEFIEAPTVEDLTIDGRTFECFLSVGRIPRPHGTDALRVWASSRAPTPGGVLRWELVSGAAPERSFRYVALGPPAVAEYVVHLAGGARIEGRIFLGDEVPGRIIQHERFDLSEGFRKRSMLETLDYCSYRAP